MSVQLQGRKSSCRHVVWLSVVNSFPIGSGTTFLELKLNARRFAFSFGFIIQVPSSFFKAGIDDVFEGAPRIVATSVHHCVDPCVSSLSVSVLSQYMVLSF